MNGGEPGTGTAASDIIRMSLSLRVSTFTVQAFAAGMLSALGHDPTFAARDYSGEIECNPDTGEGASLVLRVKAASLKLVNDFSSKDRRTIEDTMQAEVLESATFPDITYDSPASVTVATRTVDGQFDLAMNGTLALHGVSRRHPITAKVIASAAMLRAFGQFAIRQSDYGIKPVNVGGGALKVKDELKCVFDVVARP